jgi:hypothetical protein
MVNILKSILGRRIGFDATQPNANLVIEGGLIINNNTVPTTISGGSLSNNVTTIGSSATNTTQTLMTYTIPASTLKAAGNGVMVTAFGKKAGNAAGVTLQLKVGGATINSGNETQSGVSWTMTARYVKTTSDNQTALLQSTIGTLLVPPVSTTDTSTDTGTILVAVTMLDASAAQSNLLEYGLLVTNF